MNKIGIIGAGNIGLTLASLILKNKLADLDHLKISFKGDSNTLERLRNNYLDKTISSNEEIFKKSDIVFLTIKPKDYVIFKKENETIIMRGDTIIVSTVQSKRKVYSVLNIFMFNENGKLNKLILKIVIYRRLDALFHYNYYQKEFL